MGALLGFLSDRRTVRVCQIVIGILLGVAGLAKLGDLPRFALQVHNYRIVPIATEHLLAATLPWIELVAALALVLGVRARSGAFVATGMLTVFTVAIIAAVARGLDFECGCFGTADASRVGVAKVLQNLAMLGLALVGSLKPR